MTPAEETSAATQKIEEAPTVCSSSIHSSPCVPILTPASQRDYDRPFQHPAIINCIRLVLFTGSPSPADKYRDRFTTGPGNTELQAPEPVVAAASTMVSSHGSGSFFSIG